jgi:hypothetical protein
MPWHPDIPEFPGGKPRILEKLEKLPPEMINAMTGLEVDEHVRDAANSLAQGYHSHCKKNKDYGYGECVLFVSGALSQLGSSVSGKLGMNMVGKSHQSASEACKQYFPEEEQE